MKAAQPSVRPGLLRALQRNSSLRNTEIVLETASDVLDHEAVRIAQRQADREGLSV
jgi:hypothetical protein